MRKMKCNVWVLITGITLLWTVAGCSSQLETTILSEKAPPEPEVTEVQEEPVPTPEPVVSESTVGEEDLGKPSKEPPPPVVAVPPMEMAVEEPAKPIIRPSEPEKAMATSPVKEKGAETVMEPTPSVAAGVAGIPPIFFDPELPPQPTVRKGASEEVVMLEPEPVTTPEKEGMVPPPAEGEPFRMPSGIPPSGYDPELPPDPTLREGQPAEIAKLEPASPTTETESPVEEKPLEVVKVAPVAPVMATKNLGDVYFDYDRFSLREDDKNKLNENAQLIADQFSGKQVVIEGHCDERGTASYNMILGKRRAETVKKFLVDLGVPEQNLEVVSYGKEKPFCTDHSLECWQENRRGHFVVR